MGEARTISSASTFLQGTDTNLTSAINTGPATSGVIYTENGAATSTATISGSGSFTMNGSGDADACQYEHVFPALTSVTNATGTLAFSAANQLGNASATNGVSLSNNATLSLVSGQFATAPSSVDLGSARGSGHRGWWRHGERDLLLRCLFGDAEYADDLRGNHGNGSD